LHIIEIPHIYSGGCTLQATRAIKQGFTEDDTATKVLCKQKKGAACEKVTIRGDGVPRPQNGG
jgi:hypothetical protein